MIKGHSQHLSEAKLLQCLREELCADTVPGSRRHQKTGEKRVHKKKMMVRSRCFEFEFHPAII